MPEEKDFKTTSGKNVTVVIGDDGEPEGIKFEEPTGYLTELEVIDIHEYMTEGVYEEE